MATLERRAYSLDFQSDLSLAAPRPVPLPPAGTQKVFNGTAGNNHFTGTAKADTFNMSTGGNDTVSGKGGNDVFNFGGALTKNDKIDGGSGNDKVNLGGNYTGAHALKFGAATMKNVETLHLANNSYDLTMNDGNVAGNHSLTVDARALAGTRTFTFNGAPEKNGSFTILGGSALSVVTGGAKGDTFDFGAHFHATDRINGGGGDDTLILNGDYARHPLIFEPDTIRSVETIGLTKGHDYNLTLDNGNAFNALLTIDAGKLGAGNHLYFDGSAESLAAFQVLAGKGNDVIVSGAGDDAVTTGAGTDIVHTGDGNDIIDAADHLNAADRIDGGTGDDTLVLRGGGNLTLGSDTIRNIETIAIGAVSGASASALTVDNANVAFGETLTIDARAFDADDALTVDGGAIADGRLRVLGGAGADTVTLGSNGQDIVTGGGGNDQILAFGNFTADNRIDGGDSFDTLFLDGDYSDGLTFQPQTVRNIESITFAAGHDYNLVLADGNIAANHAMDVNASALGSGDHLVVDDLAETNGGIACIGGAGADTVILGSGPSTVGTNDGDDTIDASRGGNVFIFGGNGNDTFILGAAFNSLDEIDGDAGTDTLLLDGDYSSSVLLPDDVEIVKLAAGNDYTLSYSGSENLTLDAQHLAAGNALFFDGSLSSHAETVTGGRGDDNIDTGSGADTIHGGNGDDVILAGNGADTIFGGFGADLLTGGGGADLFSYAAGSDSSGAGAYDTISGLNLTGGDRLHVPTAVVSTTTASAAVSTATFDSDITDAMVGLINDEAILLTANDGSLNEHKFIVVDVNGTTGYQAGEDLVIDVTGVTGALFVADFI